MKYDHDFSINIVNTVNYGFELTKNEKLLAQLRTLLQNGIVVNILVNGSKNLENYEDYYEFLNDLLPGVRLFQTETRKTAGESRWILHQETPTTFYTTIDEDDYFYDVEEFLVKVPEILKFTGTPVTFCECIWSDENCNPYKITLDTDSCKLGDPLDPKVAKVNLGAIYNKTLLDKKFFWKPWLNGYEEDVFYMYLCSEYKNVTYVKDFVMSVYNNRVSTISVEMQASRVSNPTLEYITDFAFSAFRMKLVRLIRFNENNCIYLPLR